ncbi:18293_t:CDS:2, partial [Racocetra persica]
SSTLQKVRNIAKVLIDKKNKINDNNVPHPLSDKTNRQKEINENTESQQSELEDDEVNNNSGTFLNYISPPMNDSKKK